MKQRYNCSVDITAVVPCGKGKNLTLDTIRVSKLATDIMITVGKDTMKKNSTEYYLPLTFEEAEMIRDILDQILPLCEIKDKDWHYEKKEDRTERWEHKICDSCKRQLTHKCMCRNNQCDSYEGKDEEPKQA